jgi:outer membrane protein
MKKTYFNFLMVLLPLIFSFTVHVKAQKIWNLEDCIGYALDNNLQIKREQLRTELAKNNLFQSKIDLLPDLGAGGSHTFGGGRTPDYSSFSYSNHLSSGNFGLQSTLVLFSGLQKINTIKMNSYNFLLINENYKKAINDISLAIASAYLQILFNRELLEIAKSQISVTKLQVEKTSKLVEVGNLARGSLLDIQAQKAAEDASVTNAQNNLNISYLTLAQILDLDTVKNFTIAVPEGLNIPEMFNENSDSIYHIALGNQPEIKSSEFALKYARSNLAIARGGRAPVLSLTGNYYTQYNLNAMKTIVPYDPLTGAPAVTADYPVKEQLKDNLYKQISINLSIPIFSKWQIQTKICNAKINVADAEYALKQSQLTLRKEIEQAYADALAAFQNYKSNMESVSAHEENFKYVQQKFDVGLINSVDYNIAKNANTKAKSDLLQAKYEFIFKSKILEFYKGNVIKL